MASVFSLILNMSIIIVIVLLVRQCIRKLPKIYSYVLWSVVLFRLLCPISISLPVSILAPLSNSSSQSSAAVSTMEYVSVHPRRQPAVSRTDIAAPAQLSLSDTDKTAQGAAAPAAVISDDGTDKAETAPTKTHMTAGEIILTVCGWLWAVGIAAMLGITVWQHIRLKKLLETAWILRGNVYESENIDTAFVMGVFRPRIYLPSGLPFDVQKAVLLHEQTHQSRGDNIVKLVAYFALAAHWFNPLVWLAYKLSCGDMESSCDEAVLRGLNKRGYEMKSVKYAYGKMLVALGSGQWNLFSPVSFAENDTKARVMNVAKYKRVAVRSMIALILMCAVVLGAGCINPVNRGAGMSLFGLSKADSGTYIKVGTNEYPSDSESLEIHISSPKDMEDLYNLRFFPNLKSLVISDGGEVTYEGTVDISFIENLSQLEELSICYLNIKDYSPVLGCSQLNSIELRSFLSFDPFILREDSFVFELKELRSLTVDYIDVNCVSKLSELRNLKSLELIYGFTNGANLRQRDTVGGFTAMGVRLLREAVPGLESLTMDVLSKETADEISKFEKLTSLTVGEGAQDVELDESEYTSDWYEEFKNLTSVKSLSISMAHCYSAAFLRGMPELEELYISQYNVQYEMLSREQFADLWSMYMRNYGYIGECTRLKSLDITTYISAAVDDNSDIELMSRPLTFLDGLPELQSLAIHDISVDLASLSCVDTLKELFLEDTNIANTEAIGDLIALEKLETSGSAFDGESVSGINLSRALGKLKNLKEIVLEQGTTYEDQKTEVDLSFFSRLTSLESVHVSASSIYNISGLRNLPNLRRIYLNYVDDNVKGYEDFSALNNLTGLNELSLHCSNRLKDVSFITSMPSLRNLYLTGDFSEMPDISGLTKLESVGISAPRLRSLNGLSDSISELRMEECHSLYDASKIGGIGSLESLYLDISTIADISFLKSNKRLRDLYLYDKQYQGEYGDYISDSDVYKENAYENIRTDFSVLKEIMPKLNKFYYDGDYLTQEEMDELKALNPDGFFYD